MYNKLQINYNSKWPQAAAIMWFMRRLCIRNHAYASYATLILPMPLAIAIEHIINIYADSCLFFYTHTHARAVRNYTNAPTLGCYLCFPRLLKLFSLAAPPAVSPAGTFPCLGTFCLCLHTWMYKLRCQVFVNKTSFACGPTERRPRLRATGFSRWPHLNICARNYFPWHKVWPGRRFTKSNKSYHLHLIRLPSC